MIKKVIIAGVLLWLVTSVSSSAASDIIVTADVEQQNGGMYLYDYTLINPAQSNLLAINLSISAASDASLQSFTEPSGWVVSYTPGDTVVSWSISDVQYSISSGNMADFTFLSLRPPALGQYSALGFDPDTFAIGFSSGDIASPVVASVPEPSSIKLIGFSALLLIAVILTRVRKSA